ncbi:anti sigma factor C-terminal domain-containing protein [Clostridium sp.]|uniref:anti sigma factor C-terminal domain-containing protein n=1 Tax=Clostridium sp. TaxID=1506 RepID=UPI001ED63C50|nr:anti sigma factor C-terminal domain-containing protein [Clostridium sp.]
MYFIINTIYISEKFLSTFFNINNISTTMYSEALKYVEENGVKKYGILLYSDVDTFLKLAEDDLINSVYIDNVKFSVLQR